MMHRLSPNQSLQLTAGRSDTPALIMKTPPLQPTFAPATVAELILVRPFHPSPEINIEQPQA